MSNKTREFINNLINDKIISKDRILTDPTECVAYSYDNSRIYHSPDLVIFPLNEKEIIYIVSLANKYLIPITARGRGTNTTGASVPISGGLVLSLERMNKVIKFEPENKLIVVESGILNQTVQDLVKPKGFFWAPDPSSQAYCTVGGNLATCAGGPHSIKYGNTREHVLGLNAITGSANLIKVGYMTTKGSAGYDLTRLLIGSEGTLGIITQVTLKLTPLPEKTQGITAYYNNLNDCVIAITKIMAQSAIPSALEFLDNNALNLIKNRYPNLIPDSAHSMLMIEIDGFESEIELISSKILKECQNSGLIDAKITKNMEELWIARKALSPLLRDIAPKKINEDVIVPVSKLPELLSNLEIIVNKYQIMNVNFGHAGNGNIHVNLLINPDDENQLSKSHQCLDEIFNLVLQLEGSISGEHGIGLAKKPYFPKAIDANTLDLMKQIKQVFDPNNILNPEKIF